MFISELIFKYKEALAGYSLTSAMFLCEYVLAISINGPIKGDGNLSTKKIP